MVLDIVILSFGVFCCATAVIMIKACDVHPVLLAGYRQLVAVVVLLPVFVRDLRRHRDRWSPHMLRRALLPGALLAVHFISWIIGARMTPAANASLIVNFVPMALPFFLFFIVHERLTRGELIGTVLAMTGIVLLSAGDYHISRESFWGDVVCFGSMLFFALYLAMGRHNRSIGSTWLYVVPLYAVGGVICLAVGCFMVNPFTQSYPLRDILGILGLGIVPTVFGHSILNRSMQRLRGQLVGIFTMGQFIFAAIMAFLLLDELPPLAFYPAAVLLVGGGLLAIRDANR